MIQHWELKPAQYAEGILKKELYFTNPSQKRNFSKMFFKPEFKIARLFLFVWTGNILKK